MSQSTHDESLPRYRVVVDGREMSIDQPQVAVVELWALFALDPSMELVVEGGGPKGADRMLEPDGSVDLDADHAVHIFSRPPTLFG